MSRRAPITPPDIIDRAQTRRVIGGRMWSEAPVPPAVDALWTGDGWDPAWDDTTPAQEDA